MDESILPTLPWVRFPIRVTVRATSISVDIGASLLHKTSGFHLAGIRMQLNLSKPPASTSFYDPVFTEEDMKEFEALGLNAINGREALVSKPLSS